MDQPEPSPPAETTARVTPSNVVALLCGIWFLLTGWMWLYLVNVLFSYPFALLGLGLWLRARKTAPGSILNRIAIGLLAAGLVVSLAAFALMLRRPS